jgi:hypothetical protein
MLAGTVQATPGFELDDRVPDDWCRSRREVRCRCRLASRDEPPPTCRAAVRVRYNLVTELQPQWESGYFFLGRYYDILLKSVEVGVEHMFPSTVPVRLACADPRCRASCRPLRCLPPRQLPPRRAYALRGTSICSPSSTTTAGRCSTVRRPPLLLSLARSTYRARNTAVITAFAPAGEKFIYESLPRALSLWFDYGAALASSKKADHETYMYGAGWYRRHRCHMSRCRCWVAGFVRAAKPSGV